MTSDFDIYRSAAVMVKRHAEDAPIEAAMRADAMLEAGNLDSYAMWKRILGAVENFGVLPRATARRSSCYGDQIRNDGNRLSIHSGGISRPSNSLSTGLATSATIAQGRPAKSSTE